MASALPIGEKTSAVLGICNREEITAVTGWRRLCPSIYKSLTSNAFRRKCLAYHKGNFHISLAVAALIVDVEILTSHLPN